MVRLAHVVGVLHTLLPAFQEDSYWGPAHLAVVTGLRDARADRVRLGFQAKLLAATEYFASLFPGMGLADRETVLIAMEARRPITSTVGPDRDLWEQYACPACGRSGYLYYSLENQDDHEEVADYGDEEIDEIYVMVSVEWSPFAFECPVCNLDLNQDEVELVDGVESFIADDKVALKGDALRSYWEYEDYERDSHDWT
jgi:hypothetical protein